MVWRDILAFADASDDGLARAKIAQDIADAHKAHLEVDVVSPLPAPPYGPGAEMISQIYADALAPARAASAAAVAKVRAALRQDVEAVSVHERDCIFSDARALAARAARTSDLVVLGKPEGLDRSDLDTEIFLGAVFGGGHPCLVLPRWIQPHKFGRRVLIAWKSTPEAARAVQAAMPFIAAAEAVRISVANPRSGQEGEDAAGLDRLATYLMRHGARVEPPVVRSSWEGPEKMFPSEIEAFNADMLVMGAYSRPRLQEIVFGGMTAAMVREARIPLLITH
jgi:nucleotide-binding universal stress UspA family protein